jgi:hypothetical protein
VVVLPTEDCNETKHDSINVRLDWVITLNVTSKVKGYRIYDKPFTKCFLLGYKNGLYRTKQRYCFVVTFSVAKRRSSKGNWWILFLFIYYFILASCPDKIARLLWECYFSKNENTAPWIQQVNYSAVKEYFETHFVGRHNIIFERARSRVKPPTVLSQLFTNYIIERNKHLLFNMETWECHQMIRGKWLILKSLFLTFVTPLLGWKMALWFSVARGWPNNWLVCFHRKAYLKQDNMAGFTTSLSLKWCIILVCLRNFNYGISVVFNLAPCNFTGCCRGGTHLYQRG